MIQVSRTTDSVELLQGMVRLAAKTPAKRYQLAKERNSLYFLDHNRC